MRLQLPLLPSSAAHLAAGHPLGRDIHYDNVSLLCHGHELLADTRLELNFGRCA